MYFLSKMCNVDIPVSYVSGPEGRCFFFKQKNRGNLRDDECYELTGFCWVTGALFEVRASNRTEGCLERTRIKIFVADIQPWRGGSFSHFFCNKQLTSKFKNLRLLKDASTKRSFCNHPNHLHYNKIHDVVGWTCSCDLKDAERLQLFSCCPEFGSRFPGSSQTRKRKIWRVAQPTTNRFFSIDLGQIHSDQTFSRRVGNSPQMVVTKVRGISQWNPNDIEGATSRSPQGMSRMSGAFWNPRILKIVTKVVRVRNYGTLCPEYIQSWSNESPRLTHHIFWLRHWSWAYIWLMFMANIGKYTIHGSYG